MESWVQIIIQRACAAGTSDARFLLLAFVSLSIRHLPFSYSLSLPIIPHMLPLEAPPAPDPGARATLSTFTAPPPSTAGVLRRHSTQLVRPVTRNSMSVSDWLGFGVSTNPAAAAGSVARIQSRSRSGRQMAYGSALLSTRAQRSGGSPRPLLCTSLLASVRRWVAASRLQPAPGA